MMVDCLFCKIASGEMSAAKEYEDSGWVAFHDIHPKAPVHLLLVPKKHLELKDELNLEKESLGSIFPLAKELAAKMGISESGYKLVVNCGRGAGQVIDHLHVHLIGGWSAQDSREMP